MFIILFLSYYVYCVFQDCFTAITDFFNERLHIIGYIGISAAGVMVRICKCINYSGIHNSLKFYSHPKMFPIVDHRNDLQHGSVLCHQEQ